MNDKYQDSDSEELIDDDLILDTDLPEATDQYEYDSSDLSISSSSDYVEDMPKSSDDSDSPDYYDDEVENESESSEIAGEPDYYDDDYEDEPVEKSEPKQPKLDPEDPDYWLDERSEFDHILPKPKKAWKWWLIGAAAFLIIIGGLWVWFFRPYVDDAVKYGYIKSMERRGSLVKTFEGVLIPYREIGDPTPTYFEEIQFSVANDSLAARMKELMLARIPVKVGYEVYRHPILWKGSSPMLIIAADTADVNSILPPDYR